MQGLYYVIKYIWFTDLPNDWVRPILVLEHRDVDLRSRDQDQDLKSRLPDLETKTSGTWSRDQNLQVSSKLEFEILSL